MNLSRKWLNEFVTVTADDRTFAEEMTLSGSKVEVTEDMAEGIENVVVGKVLSLTRHENSDHMWVCMVDIGADAPVQIVTGAQNVTEGALVPVAKDGAKLPGGVEIHSGQLRGVLHRTRCARTFAHRAVFFPPHMSVKKTNLNSDISYCEIFLLTN